MTGVHFTCTSAHGYYGITVVLRYYGIGYYGSITVVLRYYGIGYYGIGYSIVNLNCLQQERW